MRSLNSSLVLVLLSYLTCAYSDIPLHCAYTDGKDNEACQQPLQDVTVVTPGSFYVAKVPCLDCPAVKITGEGANRTHIIAEAENELFFNITLSHSNTTLLLNDRPIFPTLDISPFPPRIYTGQIEPNATRADLDASISCTFETRGVWCIQPSISTVTLNYDYFAKHLESRPEAGTEKWEITFDAIGGQDGYMNDPVWVFDEPEQKMLRIMVQGRKVEEEGAVYVEDLQAASSLFGPVAEEPEIQYELEIVSVELVERSYKFLPPATPTLWSRVRRFFGLDIVRKDGHIVYLQEEWGWYGKKGTLKNELGKIWNDWPWDLVFIVVGSVLGGLVVLYGLYRLCVLVMQQRDLARWDGMDAVWERIRRDRGDEEEEDRLLDGGYRDDIDGADDNTFSRYTDDVLTVKPLPSKPLPEKPLPAVPLIDA